MVDTKKILIFTIILFVSSGCKKSPTAVVDSDDTHSYTLNEPDLGREFRTIEDYWYNFEEAVESQFLYHNYYITGGSNTIGSPTSLNPYRDTLLFRTFPGYTVEVDNGVTLPYDSTISYMLSLTESNYVQHSNLYLLDETNTDALNWCDSMLVTYAGDCPPQVEVDFDYQFSTTGTGAQVDDTQFSPAKFPALISKKEMTFSESWTNIKSLVWDNDLNRYSMIFEDSDSTKSVYLCAGICDSTKLDTALPPCTNTLTTSCYDSTYVIRNIKDEFDSLIYIGIIDTSRNPVNDLMLIDRNEWKRIDSTYKSSNKP